MSASRPLRAAVAGTLLAIAVLAAACGASAVSPGDNPTAPATPEWNVQQEYLPAATPAVAEVIPTATPVSIEAPAPVEAPRVLWMRTSHAGPGAVTIRFETNVATTAKVMAMTNQVGPASFYSEELTTPATLHTTSIPASAFGRYQVRVQNAEGEVARAELRYRSDPEGIDWGTGAAAPALKAPSAKQLDVTYAFPAGHPSKLGLDGTVRLFVTDPGCTTADACPGDQHGPTLEAPATGNAQFESHKVIASIPGAGFDYQVIVGQPLNEASSMVVFLQLEIRGDELPAAKFPGPGNIKN